MPLLSSLRLVDQLRFAMPCYSHPPSASPVLLFTPSHPPDILTPDLFTTEFSHNMFAMVPFVFLSGLWKLSLAQDDGYFLNPPNAGKQLFFLENDVYLVGDTLNVQWVTSLSEYSLWLWQQSLTAGSAVLGQTIYSTSSLVASSFFASLVSVTAANALSSQDNRRPRTRGLQLDDNPTIL